MRAVLPDAVFTIWAKVAAAILRAIRQAPRQATPSRDPGTPLLSKLGIGESSRVVLLHVPDGFELPGVHTGKHVGEAAWASAWWTTRCAPWMPRGPG